MLSFLMVKWGLAFVPPHPSGTGDETVNVVGGGGM